MRVGVFDSGLGGLTVLSAIRNIFENIEIFYVADTKFAPYGQKSKEEIFLRCESITKYLLENFYIDALVIACNTATSAAIKEMRLSYPDLIIVGAEPGLKPAILSSKSNSIGVLATNATLNGEKYKTLLSQLVENKEIKLFENSCVGLVEQIEKGEINSALTNKMLKEWLKPMKENGVDTIVLGCTHYPLVANSIIDIMGTNIKLIDTGDAIAKRLKDLTKNCVFHLANDRKITLVSTGFINKSMIENILNLEEITIRECEI